MSIHNMCMDINQAWTNLAPVAEEQWGHFTTKQAITAGFSRTQLMRMKKNGRIESIRPGSYRMVGAPVDFNTPLRYIWNELMNDLAYPGAHQSSVPPPLIVGFDTAADYYEVGDVIAGTWDFIATVPVNPAHSGVRIKDTELRDRHWTWREGVPIVDPPTCVMDQCIQICDGDLVGRMIADVFELDHTHPLTMVKLLEPYAHQYGFKDGVDMILEGTKYGGRPLHPATREYLERIKPAEG